MTALSPAIPAHLRGLVLVILSALLFSTAGLFAKGVGEDAWTIIFWRGLAAAAFILGYLAATGRLREEIARFSLPALAQTALMVTGSASFISAFKLTSVANVTLIYATVPFLAAALSWLAIRERPSAATLFGSSASLAGVMLIIGGAFGGGSTGGDLLALWMTFTLAAGIVLYRRWPGTVVFLPSALSSLLLLPVAMVFGDPLAADPGNIPAMAGFGLLFAMASITLMAGSRLLPAAETALLSALETPLGPIWAFCFLGEVPALTTLVGGALIFAAILFAQSRNARQSGSRLAGPRQADSG